MRNLSRVQTPSVEITQDNDQFVIQSTEGSSGMKMQFGLGKESQNRRLDGSNVTSILNWQDGKLVEQQNGGIPSTITREVSGDTLTEISKCGDVVATRKFQRQ